MHVIQGYFIMRDGRHKCCECGKDEYTAHIIDVCHDCMEEDHKQSMQDALDCGVYKCEECKESKSWWRRKFPRTARHHHKGRKLCGKHKMPEKG